MNAYKKTIFLITGGEFNNKGAQAMTFTTIGQLRTLFKNCEIGMTSSIDYGKDNDMYNVEVLPDGKAMRGFLLGGLFRLASILLFIIADTSFKEKAKAIEKFYKKADVCIDISGFSLGLLGFWVNLYYISKVIIAKRYNVKMYILPQSYGDFSAMSSISRYIIFALIKKYFSYPEIIYVREEKDYFFFKDQMKLNNIKIAKDIVLLYQEYKVSKIYTILDQTSNEIEKGSIIIAPNRGMKSLGMLNIYKQIIDSLLLNSHKIYLMHHHKDDYEFCREIKSYYLHNNAVILMEGNFDCVSLEKTIGSALLVISSRYHALVHACRENVPSIAIGWADKYLELFRIYGQERFVFDNRKELNAYEIIEKIQELIADNDLYSKKIKQQNEIIKQEASIFDEMAQREGIYESR